MWANMDNAVPDLPANFDEALPFSALSPDFDPEVIRKVDLDLSSVTNTNPPKLAFLLENVFTPAECKSLIDISEKAGYSPALVNVGNGLGIRIPDYRDSHRVLTDDKQFVSILLNRISKFLPSKFNGRDLVEINERLRFLRYDPGDKFTRHYDCAYARPDNSAKTQITLQMYLNEGFEGGETSFLCDLGKKGGEEGEPKVAVVPKTGMILVFEHKIMHEGSLVVSGRKYTIRTDVLYTYGDENYGGQLETKMGEEKPPGRYCAIA